MDLARFTRDLDFRGVASGTRWQYLRVARMYDRPDFSRDSVISFMQRFKGRSRSYTNLVLHALKSYARSLAMPWSLSRADAQRPSTPQRPFLTYAQFQQLLELARPNPQHYAILRVMGATCARREEVVRMMVEDYARPVLRIRTAKGGEPGACTLDPETCNAIETHLRSRSRASPSLFAISAASLSQVFRRYVRTLDLPPRTGLHCTPYESLVLTRDGYKEIGSITVGESVWDGLTFRRVRRTFAHHYEGNLIEIHGKGILPFKVTPNHPVLVGKKGFPFRTAWVLACDLDPQKHFLIAPKYRNRGSVVREVNLQKFVTSKWDHSSTRRYCLTEAFGRFLGLYAADGSGSVGGSGIAVGSLDEASRVSAVLKEALASKTRIVVSPPKRSLLRGKIIYGSGTIVCFSGRVLRRFLKATVKTNAHDVEVPTYILNSPQEVRKAFWEGYVDGDGHRAQDGWIQVSSVSRRSCLSLQLLLSSLEEFGYVNQGKDRDFIYYKERGKKPTRARTKVRERPGVFLIPIKLVKSTPFNGMVYNLEVAGAFCIHNIVTHNSIRRGVITWLFQAGLRERELQDVGRWKSPAMPAVYVQLVPGQVDKEVQKKHPMWEKE